jgi:hypothetical protein
MTAELQWLTVITYNVLAPCYFRAGGGVLESALRARAMERATRLGRAVGAMLRTALARPHSAALLLLQEWWFDEAWSAEVVRAAEAGVAQLGGGGAQLTWQPLQRTSRKQDGVCCCIAVRAGAGGGGDDDGGGPLLAVEECAPCAFRMAGDRVAQIVRLSLRCGAGGGGSGAGAGEGGSGAARQQRPPRLPLLVCTTHLTFPHHAFDQALRLRQVDRVLAALRGVCARAALPAATPVIVGGDLNGDGDDPAVARLVREGGLVDAYAAVHGGDGGGIVTHCSHRGGQEGVDFVLLGDAAGLRGGITEDEWEEGGAAGLRGGGGSGGGGAEGGDSGAARSLALLPTAAVVWPPTVPPAEGMPRPVVPVATGDGGDEGRRFGPGGGGGEDGDVPLTLHGWCQLSDHRPVCVALRVGFAAPAAGGSL